MDAAQRALFGEFPRSVGTPEQHIVHTEGEFDAVMETIDGHLNAYSSISWFPVSPEHGAVTVVDKVAFDFDSPEKEAHFDDDVRADEKIQRMRDDPDVAEIVLGDVCDEARQLAAASMGEGIPVMGVFSGFGLHVYQLYQPEPTPGERIGTVARYWRDELSLVHMDDAVVGDDQRIMRVPNMERVAHERDQPPYYVHANTDLWQVPLTGEELAAVTPQKLMELSYAPRPKVAVRPDERPEMPYFEEYEPDADRWSETAETRRPDGPTIEGEVGGNFIEELLADVIQLPCIYENLILDPEPPHEVRLAATIRLFNAGYKPTEVINFFSQLGWRDWDRNVTTQHVKHIWKKGYHEMSCSTLRESGFCTRTDDPANCQTYNWSGGAPEW